MSNMYDYLGGVNDVFKCGIWECVLCKFEGVIFWDLVFVLLV